MYHRKRRKMIFFCAYALLILNPVLSKNIISTEAPVTTVDDNFENNIIDFDEDVSVKFNIKYGAVPWHASDKFNKESHRYTLDKDDDSDIDINTRVIPLNKDIFHKTKFETTTLNDNSSIPPELLSTTDGKVSLIESTEEDLTVIPLATTARTFPEVTIGDTVTLPSSTQSSEVSSDLSYNEDVRTTVTENNEYTTTERVVFSKNVDSTTEKLAVTTEKVTVTTENVTTTIDILSLSKDTEAVSEKSVGNTATVETTIASIVDLLMSNNTEVVSEKLIGTTKTIQTTSSNTVEDSLDKENTTLKPLITNRLNVTLEQNTTEYIKTEIHNKSQTVKLNTTLIHTNNTKGYNSKNLTKEMTKVDKEEEDIFTSLEDKEGVPDDFYDSKDVLPTTAPKTDALSVIFGIAGSVVESVAERVVPKGIFDLFKRMQRQSEALEAERLRSREENGGLGQFGRGILKSISSGLKPLGQLMASPRDNGSLDTDRGFVSGLATGVSSVATSVADAFKDRVQAIYPGTVWCGDGHAAQARSSDLGLFFFTDTCCREHDACRIFIRAGETKYGLNNTGLFTRSHCSCDVQFRECLKRTNSLVSAQIGLTYFNVLGPQCFRRAHPIVRCVRRTRITGQKCEEYELDYTKAKMWQWFDNETF